jgi:hypothetical protein
MAIKLIILFCSQVKQMSLSGVNIGLDRSYTRYKLAKRVRFILFSVQSRPLTEFSDH